MKKALVIVDMQEDFVRPHGKLPVPNAEDIIKNIKLLVEQAGKNNIKIIYTRDWHDKNDKEFEIWPKHCIKNTEGAKIVSELMPQAGSYLIDKQELSAFSNPRCEEALKDIDEIYLTGVALEYCVYAFATGADALNIKVNLIVDAVKGVDTIPNVPNTMGKVMATCIDMGKHGVNAMYIDEAIEDMKDNTTKIRRSVK